MPEPAHPAKPHLTAPAAGSEAVQAGAAAPAAVAPAAVRIRAFLFIPGSPERLPVELAHTWGIPDSSGGVLAGEEGDEFLALTAGTLMSKPAITVRPDATIAGAARMMNTHGIGRLPVVDSKGKLVGIVSRRDLLSVFLRPDADIAHDVRQLLEELALVDPMGIVVRVRHGVVNLSRPFESSSLRQQDLISVVLRLVWDVDGVVDVVNRLDGAAESKTARPGAPRMPRQPEET